MEITEVKPEEAMNGDPNDPLNTPELNKAAYEFQNSMPVIKSRSNALSKNSLRRVFNAIVEFPLSKEQPRFKNKFEHELFVLTLHALGVKNIMMKAVLENQKTQEALLKQAAEEMNKEGEVNNG